MDTFYIAETRKRAKAIFKRLYNIYEVEGELDALSVSPSFRIKLIDGSFINILTWHNMSIYMRGSAPTKVIIDSTAQLTDQDRETLLIVANATREPADVIYQDLDEYINGLFISTEGTR